MLLLKSLLGLKKSSKIHPENNFMKKIFIALIFFLYFSNSFSQWISQRYPPNSFWTYYSSFFMNSNTGYICGDGFVVLKSTNGGSNWLMDTLNGYTCFGMDFINSSNGALAGYNNTWGQYCLTTNSGLNWTKYENFGAPILTNIKYASLDTLYSCGRSGFLMKSTNGGLNFFQLSTGVTDELRGLAVINNSIVYAAGDNGVFLKTTNGGTNWISLISGTNFYISNIQFLNTNTGFYSAYGDGTIGRTINGGLNWTHLPTQTNVQMTCVYFTSQLTGYAIGVYQEGSFSYHKVIKTTDGGLDWQNLTTGKGNFAYMRTIFFVNDNTGWIAGDGARIFKTTSGGVTFINQNGEIVSDYILHQNYPNPFNPNTKINYSLQKANYVSINIYDAAGKLIKILESGFKREGSYSVNFSGEGLASGVYYYSLVVDGVVMDTKKAILLK